MHMKANLYIIILFSIFLCQDGVEIGQFHTEFRKHFSNGTLDEILEAAQEKLKDKDLCPQGSYNELYLKIWEIKGYFYKGEIEKSFEKFEELRFKIEKDNYDQKIFSLPFFDYLDSPDKQENTCIVKTFLSSSNFMFWNLEIFSDDLFYEHFSDLHLMVGRNLDDEYNVIVELHDQETRIINKDGSNVTYSIFPPLVSFKPQAGLDAFNTDLIIEYEFEIAKENRIRLLQEQQKTSIEFKDLLKEDVNNEEVSKSYSCKIVGLPIVQSNNMPFYKLYIHDNKSVDRYSFEIKRSRKSNPDIILLHWKNKNWDMQKLFDKSKIVISIPEMYTKKNWEGKSAFRISLEGNPKSLSDNRERGLTAITDNKETESILKENLEKWHFIEGEDYSLSDYQFYKDEEGNRFIKVERVEIDLNKINNEINIEVTDDFADTNSKSARNLKFWTRAFYSAVILGLAMLFY